MTYERGTGAGDGQRNQKGIRIDLMDGQARNFRPALTFGFGLLSTAILISAGSNVQADTGANDLSREFVSDFSSDRNSEDVEAIFSTESLFDLHFGQRENGAVTYDIPFPFTTLTQRIAAH